MSASAGGRWFRVSITTVVLGLLLAVACSTPEPPDPASGSAGADDGGTIVIGHIADVDSLNEYLSRQAFAVSLMRRVYLRLAREVGSGREQPVSFAAELAESWVRGEDGLSWTFTLRDATWSDGRPVSADDVRFTWEAQTSEDVPWIGAAAKEHITDVEVVDPTTVTFHFDVAYPDQLADAVEGGILPRHVFESIPFESWANHDWSTVRVGSGPFLLARYQSGHEIVLERNPRYYRTGHPHLERVVVRIVPDSASLLAQLQSGDIDFVEGIEPRDANRLSRSEDVSLVRFFAPRYDFIGWNASRAPFDDPRLRRAITLAIDREAIVDELMYGFGQISKGPVLSSWWGTDRTIEPWPYDPDRSRELLAELGYGDGNELQFELITNSGNRLREETLLKVQDQLARVGVTARIRPLETGRLRQRVGAGDYDGFLGGWVFSGKVELEGIFGSRFAPPNGLNVVFYESPEVDDLLGRLDRAHDWQAMKLPLHQIQRRIHDDQPYTFLYEPERVAGYGRRLSGVSIDIPSDPLARLEEFRLGPS